MPTIFDKFTDRTRFFPYNSVFYSPVINAFSFIIYCVNNMESYLVDGVDICAILEQKMDHWFSVLLTGDMQGSKAILDSKKVIVNR